MNRSFIFASLLLVTACTEMYSPPSVNDRPMQVREEQFTQQTPVRQINENYVASVVQDYSQSGRGPIDVTITYDPLSKSNTAMRASDEAVRISREMRKQGAGEVITNLLPVREQGPESVAIIAYSSYQAAASSSCGTMPGMAGAASIDHDANYKMGCSLDTVFAKQIADPSDLLGDARASAYSEGRPASNQIEMYRVGAPNKPLGGVSASDD